MAISNAQLMAALKSAGGIQALAAEKLGTTRQNVCQRIAKSPALQAFKAEVEQTIVDQAEAVVVSALQEKQPGTAKPTKEALRVGMWMLDRKGRDRGYTTRSEVTGADGAPLQIAAPPVHIHVQYVDGSPEPTAGEDEII